MLFQTRIYCMEILTLDKYEWKRMKEVHIVTSNLELTDGMATILLAETERPVIPHPQFLFPEVFTLYWPRYSRNPA